jgi:hypothetical protein
MVYFEDYEIADADEVNYPTLKTRMEELETQVRELRAELENVKSELARRGTLPHGQG